jgi:Short C-terminal domain/Phospholipase_D-nuclease N-terminal
MMRRGRNDRPDQEAIMLAYDYPILGLFWTMLMVFIWVAWIFLLIRVFADLFRNHDMNGWVKGLWAIFVIIVPFLGVLIYLIVYGHGIAERDMQQAQAQQDAFQQYVRQTAGTGGSADEIAKLADLKSKGVLTDAEFEQQKAKLLA